MKFTIKEQNTQLCARCKWGMVTTQQNGNVLTYCTEMCKFVPSDIVKCNNFLETGAVSEWDMEKIAWTVRTDNSGKILGFNKPTKKE